jgi:hypothetical protein
MGIEVIDHPTSDPISRERKLRRKAKHAGLRLISTRDGYVLVQEAGILTLEQAEKIVDGKVQ